MNKYCSINSHRRMLVPETVDCLKPLLAIIPLQLISYHLAGMKGVNVSHRFQKMIS